MGPEAIGAGFRAPHRLRWATAAEAAAGRHRRPSAPLPRRTAEAEAEAEEADPVWEVGELAVEVEDG